MQLVLRNPYTSVDEVVRVVKRRRDGSWWRLRLRDSRGRVFTKTLPPSSIRALRID